MIAKFSNSHQYSALLGQYVSTAFLPDPFPPYWIDWTVVRHQAYPVKQDGLDNAPHSAHHAGL
jgi:hypothetical protein